ncbi:recombinase family protein [Cytobacillus horneckiae]|uniref:recombinase family protein n=1 Tax=Cytobacillus horneckiae TaxID=549687 RepID=UPI0034CF98CC
MNKTAIYTRVSTDKEEQKLSFKSQAEYYNKYCEEKGFEVYDIYADEGITGTKKNRKQFINMMYDAGLDTQKDEDGVLTGFKASKRKPKFNYILMKDITRFSRNTNVIDTVRALRSKKVFLIFEDMNLTTEKKDWELEFNLYLTFSQQESLDKSNKLRWAYERRKEKGIWHMSNPLFGYKYVKEKKNYIVNEEEAKWVRKAFSFYINEKWGTQTIATYFNDNGVKTRRGKDWRQDGIKRMITNEKYTGKVIIGKLRNADVTSETKTKQANNPDEWKVIENGIPAIIDNETFQKAQKILSERVYELSDGTKKGARKIKNIFHQKIKCAKCDSYYTRVKGTKIRNGVRIPEYNYYCMNRRTFGKKSCDMRGVSHKVLIRELQRMIDTGIINNLILKTSGEGNDGLENNLFEDILKQIEKERCESQSKIDELQREIDIIAAKIDTLYENFLSGEVNEKIKSITMKKIETLGTDQEQLEIQKLNYSFSVLDEKERNVKEYYESMKELTRRKTYTVENLIEWIDRIEVNEGKKLCFYFSFPSMYKLQLNNFSTEEHSLVTTRFDVTY